MAKKPNIILSQLQTNPSLLAGGVAAGLVGGGLLLATWRWWRSLNAAAEVMRRYGLAPWHLLDHRTWRAVWLAAAALQKDPPKPTTTTPQGGEYHG